MLAVVSGTFWLGLDAALRPAVAAAGGILVVLAIQRATSLARGVRQRQTVATGEMSIPPSTRR